jgi:hypothetical protein
MYIDDIGSNADIDDAYDNHNDDDKNLKDLKVIMFMCW